MWYKNIAGRFFGLVRKHACDRRTDGQNYDSQDRASIAASRGPSATAELLVNSDLLLSRGRPFRQCRAIVAVAIRAYPSPAVQS